MAAVAAPGHRSLLERTNRHAAALLTVHATLLVATGAWVWQARGSWWVVPALVVDGVVLAHLFALFHECSHRTAFRARRANQAVAWGCGLVIGLPPRYFRLEHTAHHRFAQQPGHDPELITVPADRRRYALFLAGVPYWTWAVRTLAAHAAGRLLAFEVSFVPAGEWPRVRREARLFVAIYAAAIAVSVATGSTALVWLWLLPRLVGEPAMRLARLSEHAGQPLTSDVAENTRSLRVAAPLRLLAWNMPYHAEHHASPSVPFHALAAWRRQWPEAPPATGGYLAAQAGILREMKRRRTAVADPAGSVAG